ncbi:hypothetical protein AYO21_10112 [Fonsecaea monophora]|uniref:Methyltransferase small domain-containing protein n=1 Tax=Fonsecaea monophora TaxID=254056 RepID=A0A177EUS6_9EURO|nr:hypothetical protein AYO21_10112 [Fonsecaea monophora]KAH0846105.1 hypothetical protein FOPE_11464 [Fonsecaea pedrosoi]OAG35718.1 hypothetical protein AYO21_10112 [Fonsecaea monophora]
MPRLPPALIHEATSQNPLLTPLLRVCRDLPSARNELRWLQEHARDVVDAKRYASHETTNNLSLPGLDATEEVGSSHRATAWSDDVKIEDGRRPWNPSQRHPTIRKTFGGRRIRKVATIPTEPVLSASTPETQSVQIRKHEVGGTAHLEAELQKLTVRKIRGQTDRTGTEAYNVGSITTVKAEGTRPSIRKVPLQNEQSTVHTQTNVNVTSLHDKSDRGLRIAPSSDADLVNGEASKHKQVQKVLTHNVGKRSKGMPLQYIMGNQPFGNLDILCRRGVLIPRPETEMYTEKAANLLLSALASTRLSTGSGLQSRKKFRILDLCTGTGCIALLLHSILKPPVKASGYNSVNAPDISVEILGLDNNPLAISLARKNLAHNMRQKLLHPDAGNDVSFQNIDVLGLAKKGGDGEDKQHQISKILNEVTSDVGSEEKNSSSPPLSWDMIIANPPYVGPKDYEPGGKTEPSVRNYEPKEALVPTFGRGEDWHRYQSPSILLADLFYWPLMRIARAVGAKVLVMEVGDSSQASRVCKQFFQNYSSPAVFEQLTPRLETWRDDGSIRILPTQTSPSFDADFENATDPSVSDRAVVVWTKDMADWRRDSQPRLLS